MFSFPARRHQIPNFKLCPLLSRCRKIFSDDNVKLEEAELPNALTEITPEHNSVIQTKIPESKAWWVWGNPGPDRKHFAAAAASDKHSRSFDFQCPYPHIHTNTPVDWLERTSAVRASLVYSWNVYCARGIYLGVYLGHERFLLFFYSYII